MTQLTFLTDEFLEPSDEEVLADAPSPVASDVEYGVHEPQRNTKVPKLRPSTLLSDSEGSSSPEGDEDFGGWGASKRDYYNADVIETEADALEEEAEAIRLQKKHLQGLAEADFGLDEAIWLDTAETGEQDVEDEKDIVSERLPQLEIADDMGPDERLRVLKIRYPEFEPLAKEFLDLQARHEDLRLAGLAASSIKSYYGNGTTTTGSPKPESFQVPVAGVKYNALSAYLAALSMYFALLTSTSATAKNAVTAKAPAELRDHTIMETILQCRGLWEKVKDIPVPAPAHQVNGHLQETNSEPPNLSRALLTKDEKVDLQKVRAKRKGSRKSKAQKSANAAEAEAKKLRNIQLHATEEELARVSALASLPRLSTKSTPQLAGLPQLTNEDDSDIGEETTMTVHEAAEKARKKKSLRFYTSQIAQKANKRDAAGRDAGGDTDIPHRERLKDRQIRLNSEAERRGQKSGKSSKGEPLGGDSDDEDRRLAKELREEKDGDNEYYDLIASHARNKKAAKLARSEAHLKQQAAGGRVDIDGNEEAVGPDGKRGISYAIAKNKGLTPKRKKEVRNPRVKKRKKFEDKMKKLGSTRPVYKGGEGRGGYGGELTGIKTGLVRSVKF